MAPAEGPVEEDCGVEWEGARSEGVVKLVFPSTDVGRETSDSLISLGGSAGEGGDVVVLGGILDNGAMSESIIYMFLMVRW